MDGIKDMDNKEAIEWLKIQQRLPISWDDHSKDSEEIRTRCEKKIYEAYSIAIRALERSKEDDLCCNSRALG